MGAFCTYSQILEYITQIRCFKVVMLLWALEPGILNWNQLRMTRVLDP